MALSDMKVFNEYLKSTTVETLAQDVEKFNAASAGAIQLTTQGIDGDFLQESFWAGLHGAQRRVPVADHARRAAERRGHRHQTASRTQFEHRFALAETGLRRELCGE